MKKAILLLSYILTATLSNAQAPAFEWATSAGGNSDDYGHSITTDASGNVYVTGVFKGMADFDPGPGTINLTSAGANDIFISKSDAAGNLLWVKNVGGAANDYGGSITIGLSGSIYISGYFQGLADFDPGAATFNLTSAGTLDIFILKLDPAGDFVWAKSLGGTSDDIGISMATDALDNIYTTGLFNSTVDFDPGAGVTNLISAGNNDIFVSKLDSAGNFIWAKSVGASGDDVGYAINPDVSGNVCVTGNFSGSVDFDPGSGAAVLTASPGGGDIFVLKLDASGNFIWAKGMGGPAYEYGVSIATDPSGNIYTTGNYSGTVDFDPGSGTASLTSAGQTDIFISKLDASGDFIWAKSIGGPSYDAGYSIALDASDNIYTTGYFYGSADLDPGSGVMNLITGGPADGNVFVSKLDSLGNFSWAQQLGDTQDDFGYSIHVDGANAVYTTGYFSVTADFDPGVGVTDLTSAGGEDIFVQKLSQSVSTSIATENTDKDAITLYPNPSNGTFNIVILSPENENTTVEVYNSAGFLTYTKQYSTNKPDPIDMSDRPDGIYFIRVTTDKTILSQKIIKQ